MPNPENFDHKEERDFQRQLGSQDFGLDETQTNALINKYAGGLEEGEKQSDDADQTDLYVTGEIGNMKPDEFSKFMEPFTIISQTLGKDFIDTILGEKNATYEDLRWLAYEIQPMYLETQSTILLSQQDEQEIIDEMDTRASDISDTSMFEGGDDKKPEFINRIDQSIDEKSVSFEKAATFTTTNPEYNTLFSNVLTMLDTVSSQKYPTMLNDLNISQQTQDKLSYATLENISFGGSLITIQKLSGMIDTTKSMEENTATLMNFVKENRANGSDLITFEENVFQGLDQYLTANPSITTTEGFTELMNPQERGTFFDVHQASTPVQIAEYFSKEYPDASSLNATISGLDRIHDASEKVLQKETQGVIEKIIALEGKNTGVTSLIDKGMTYANSALDTLTAVSDSYPEVRKVLEYVMKFFKGDLSIEDLQGLESDIEKAREGKILPEERAVYKGLKDVSPSKTSLYTSEGSDGFMNTLFTSDNWNGFDATIVQAYGGERSGDYKSRIVENMKSFISIPDGIDTTLGIPGGQIDEYDSRFKACKERILEPFDELTATSVTSTQKNEIILMGLLTGREGVTNKMIDDLGLKPKSVLDQQTATQWAEEHASLQIDYAHSGQKFSATINGVQYDTTYAGLGGSTLAEKKLSFNDRVRSLPAQTEVQSGTISAETVAEINAMSNDSLQNMSEEKLEAMFNEFTPEKYRAFGDKITNMIHERGVLPTDHAVTYSYVPNSKTALHGSLNYTYINSNDHLDTGAWSDPLEDFLGLSREEQKKDASRRYHP